MKRAPKKIKQKIKETPVPDTVKIIDVANDNPNIVENVVEAPVQVVDQVVKPAIVKPVVVKPHSSKPLVAIIVTVLVFIVGVVAIRQVSKSFVGEVVQTIVIATDEASIASATTTENSSLVGLKAPAFLLTGNQATSTRLLDLLNKPLLVVFWTTWQPNAVDQLRAFDQYFSENKDLAFNVVFINHQEDDVLVQSFLRRSGYDLPVLFDQTGGVGSAWRVHTVPTTYLVGTNGFVKEKIIGNYPVGVIVDKLLNINH